MYIYILVAGKRNRRIVWNHVVDSDVSTLLFTVSAIDLVKNLVEDVTVSRHKESLTLFDELCNNVFFKNLPFVLVFSKVDLFVSHFHQWRNRIIERHPAFKGIACL